MEPTRIILRAAYPSSLESAALQDLIRASVAETAEHQGLSTPTTEIHPDRIEILVAAAGPIALALAAEVRRTTGLWHRRKYGAPLWLGE
ncbi:MAG: hypothetical protein ACKO3W_08885 [bacterium]